MRKRLFASLLIIQALPLSAQVGKGSGDVIQIRGAKATDTQVVAAVKEALSLSANYAVKTTSLEDGFALNESIKIGMTDYMRSLEQGLRMAGQGLRIKDFELSMNRAAEAAAPAAGPLLAKTIASLSFTDVRIVLNGNHFAATDFLVTSSSADLTKAFRPYVEAAMNKTGVMQNYDALVIQMKGLTFGDVAPFDITGYVVRRTLEGLFFMSGKEEEKIRNDDPDAQVTPLVKEIFTKRPY
jgi:hypothetical protein